MPAKTVISASRRSDIPAFYMDWFMAGIRQGFFEVVNPYNRKITEVPSAPEKVHTIVFWSKNFGPFLSGNYGERLLDLGYHLYFSFTINSHSPMLEPQLPLLENRLAQLETLCRRFSPEWVDWRFDPICVYTDGEGNRHTNMGDFSLIADTAADSGIKRCITSYLDIYKKVERRVRKNPKITFVDPPADEKSETIQGMNDALNSRGIRLYLCCEKELLASLPVEAGIKQSACIPNHRLKKLFGGDISLAPDRGQRVKQGCGCRVSADIGSYYLHPCHHNCLFCYANPSMDKRSTINRKPNPDACRTTRHLSGDSV